MLPWLYSWQVVIVTNVLCAATYLDHFIDVSKDFANGNVVITGQISSSRSLNVPSDIEAINKCADECFLARYICNSFYVIKEHNYKKCVKVRTPSSGLSSEASGSGNVLLGVYDIRKPRDVDIIRNFSRDLMKKTGSQWANDILQGYEVPYMSSSREARLKDTFYMPFLLGCRRSAMYGKMPKRVLFRNWIQEQVPLDALSLTFENETQERRYHKLSQGNASPKTSSSTREFSTSLALWINSPSNEGSFEYFDAIALDFLGMFSQNIRQGITAIRDDVNKYLFIEGEDLHLFIASVGSGEHIIIHDRPGRSSNDPHQPRIYRTYLPLYGSYEQFSDKDAAFYELFKDIMNLLGHTNHYMKPSSLLSIKIENAKTSAIDLITMVAGIVIAPTDYSNHGNLPYSATLLVRDVVTFVLYKLYKDDSQMSSLQTQLFKDQKQLNSISDITVTTVNELQDNS